MAGIVSNRRRRCSLRGILQRFPRVFTDDTYSDSGKWMYVLHQNYADSPENFVRAFLLIQKDVLELFDYIEPSDTNLASHSHRIHELLLRTCVEIESNCTAILRDTLNYRP